MKKRDWVSMIMLMIVLAGVLAITAIYVVEEYQFCQQMNMIEGMNTHFNWLNLNCEIWADPSGIIDEWFQSLGT